MVFTPSDRAELLSAREAWLSDPYAALETYGHLSTWDTSRVADELRPPSYAIRSDPPYAPDSELASRACLEGGTGGLPRDPY